MNFTSHITRNVDHQIINNIPNPSVSEINNDGTAKILVFIKGLESTLQFNNLPSSCKLTNVGHYGDSLYMEYQFKCLVEDRDLTESVMTQFLEQALRENKIESYRIRRTEVNPFLEF